MVDSSRKKMLGSTNNSMAMLTLRRWPPLIWEPRFPGGIGQHKMVEQMREGLVVDGHRKLIHAGEIRLALDPWMMNLSKHNLFRWSLLDPPLLEPSLERPQLEPGEALFSSFRIRRAWARLVLEACLSSDRFPGISSGFEYLSQNGPSRRSTQPQCLGQDRLPR